VPASAAIGPGRRARREAVGVRRACRAHASPVAERAPPPLAQASGETAQHLRGTPAYLAPEPWRRARPTTASDVWAFGVIAFELLAGRRPYDEGEGTGFVEAILCAEPAPGLAAAGPALADEDVELVDRCLSKPDAARPTMADAVLVLGRALASGRPLLDASPFRGLLPFSESHAGLFFGRDAEVAALLERLRDTPVLAVVGFSGAGKTSFVQAGVIPRLRETEAWQVVALRPGSDPFRNLAHRLLARGTATVPQAQSISSRRWSRSLPTRVRRRPSCTRSARPPTIRKGRCA
jgi:serine/threonine protein kinase